MADTGTGATLTLATTGAIGTIKSMKLPEIKVEDIETSGLATTGQKTFIAADLVEVGDLEVEVFFSTTTNDLEDFGTSETVTVTFPKEVATNAVAPKLVGSGYIKVQKFPDLAVGELQMYTLTIKYDGITAATWTQEAAS